MRSRKFLSIFITVLLSPGVNASEDEALAEGVMAARGQGAVTAQEFDARVSQIPEKDQKTILRDPSKVRTMLANLLLTAQLAAEAKENQFEQGNDQLQLRMEMAAETELANAWLDHITYTQPDADYTALAREYYLLNQEKFKSPPSIDVTHLLIATKEHTTEEAELLAQSYLDKTLSDPTVFDELVVSYSEDPSAGSNRGKFTEVKKGVMVKPFEEAAFNLKNIGDFSGLVHTQFGFHIIRLDGIHPSRVMSFEEVRLQLETKVASEHRGRVRADYLSEFTSLPTHISEEELKAMVFRHFEKDEIQTQSDPVSNE